MWPHPDTSPIGITIRPWCGPHHWHCPISLAPSPVPMNSTKSDGTRSAILQSDFLIIIPCNKSRCCIQHGSDKRWKPRVVIMPFCRHWCHRRLSLWRQPAVAPVTTKSASWQLSFSLRIMNMGHTLNQQNTPIAVSKRNHTVIIMTSLNGNIFRVTGPLSGDFTGHRRIPLTKPSDAEFWCYLWSAPE